MKQLFLIFAVLAFLNLGQVHVFSQNFSPVKSKHGMVVTADSLASAIGVEILKKGGNAVDAAVAVAFSLTVTYPNAGNIGGGGFMLIRTPDNRVFALDYREKAPLKASRDMYLDRNGKVLPQKPNLIGYKACGVPGTVYGLWEAHKRFGKLKWKDLLKPAVIIAQKGFRINHFQARKISRLQEKLSKFSATKKIFLKDGAPLKFGQLLVQKDLANTLKRIARNGYREFYFGSTAQKIAKDMQKHGGLITLDDLKKYRPVWRNPIKINYRGYTIYSMPLPSSGGILLAEILNTLQPFDLTTLGHNSAQYIHLLTEIERHAYRDRAYYLGDPDFVSVPVTHLISMDYADSIRCHLSLLKAGKSNPNVVQLQEGMQTTHFTIADEKGWTVSNTYTLNSDYGSGVVIEGTGILMNNEMDDFSIKPGQPNQFGLVGNEANAIAPEKRMLSSMTPTIVLRNDSLFMALGSPGGSTIITSVLQVLLNTIDFGMNIRRAVEAPRFHHQWLPDKIVLEQFGFSNDTIDNLENLGYRLKFVSRLGFVQAIMIQDKTICGWADPRSPGKAIGF